MFQQTSLLNSFRSKGEKESPLVYRCRGCNNNLSANDPASQYQRQKIIQNTVRVQSSLFTMNLGALSVYERPDSEYRLVDISGSTYVVSPGVNWNQMSDRRQPHIQVVKTGAGTGYHSSSTKRTITANRPGAMSPGGAGVDIKHNSYDRYLNRLKGKGPLRRGPVPPNFGSPIPYNNAVPIYGGKTIKTNIVNSCNCPINNNNNNNNDESKLYSDPLLQPYPVTTYNFNVGDYVYAIQNGQTYYTRAQITDIVDGLYTIIFDNGVTQSGMNSGNFLIYFPCNCNGTINNITYPSGFINVNGTTYTPIAFI